MKNLADLADMCPTMSAYNLAGELIKFLEPLIANRKYNLAVAAKSAKWGLKSLAVFR